MEYRLIDNRYNFGPFSFRGNGLSNGIGIFKPVLIALSLFAFISALVARPNVLTFSGLLQSLSDCPSINISTIVTYMSNLRITSDWTWIGNPIRDFINEYFIPLCSLVVYFSMSLVQLVMYLVWFLKIFFVGV